MILNGQRKTDVEIDAKTRLTGLLGSPVAHSLSPVMHNTAFQCLGIPYCYMAFDVPERALKTAVNGLKSLNARGWNVTMPDKTAMCALVDQCSPAAAIIGAVNTVVNEGGILTGHVTDGSGFMKMLKENRVAVAGETVVLCGAGGAARAVAVQAALDGVKQLMIFNRSESKAAALADTVNRNTPCRAEAYALADQKTLQTSLLDAALLINGTKLGMAPETETSIIDTPQWLRPDMAVADLVYHPRETRLLKMARSRGCQTLGGLGMLLFQGAQAFELWTGRAMPVSVVAKQVFHMEV